MNTRKQSMKRLKRGEKSGNRSDKRRTFRRQGLLDLSRKTLKRMRGGLVSLQQKRKAVLEKQGSLAERVATMATAPTTGFSSVVGSAVAASSKNNGLEGADSLEEGADGLEEGADGLEEGTDGLEDAKLLRAIKPFIEYMTTTISSKISSGDGLQTGFKPTVEAATIFADSTVPPEEEEEGKEEEEVVAATPLEGAATIMAADSAGPLSDEMTATPSAEKDETGPSAPPLPSASLPEEEMKSSVEKEEAGSSAPPLPSTSLPEEEMTSAEKEEAGPSAPPLPSASLSQEMTATPSAEEEEMKSGEPASMTPSVEKEKEKEKEKEMKSSTETLTPSEEQSVLPKPL